jgi:urease accessory protein
MEARPEASGLVGWAEGPAPDLSEAQPRDVGAATGWHAELSLGFAPASLADPRGARTVLAHLRHRGPLRVQRAFHPFADGTCHVYVLHPPGGLVGGDVLAIDVDVAASARALVTTPAAGKLYRSERRWVRQVQTLRVAAHASLEWLPQENIFYSGAWAEVATRVELAAGATFLGWETTVLGRPAAGEAFARGSCVSRFEVWRAGRPLWLERGRYDGGDEVLAAAWGLDGCTAAGSFVAVGDEARLAALVDDLRAPLAGDRRAALTLLGDVLVARALGAEAQEVRERLQPIWMATRAALLGSPAQPPRVWAT